MTSWRTDASRQSQDDLDALLDAGLEFAQQQLAKHGEFYPFAATISVGGDLQLIAAWPERGDDRPLSADLIASYMASLAEGLDRYRAVAVIADVRTSRGDAIQVSTEHTEGHALIALLHYTKRRLGRGISYGELTASAGKRQFWP